MPEEIHRALLNKAERAGQSLQQYLSAQLALIARTPTLDEILDRIESQNLGSLPASSAITAIDEGRARR